MQRDSIHLLEQLAVFEARESFWAYRQFMNPKMLRGWWQRQMAMELQQFYVDLKAGLRPKLVLQAPPQHGKSKMVVDFITWMSGKDPDLKTIYASFSERLGVRANTWCQRIYDTEKFKSVFPDTKIASLGMTIAETQGATRNREMVEYIGREGFFRNTTVRGSVTGESLNLGVLDDPIKGREEAKSATVRAKTWEWLTDDFFTRFSDDAGFLSILTRWHVDDPIGRLKEQFGDDLKIVSYSAIADEDEEFRKAGEPLFPELKSLDFLLERKKAMATISWVSVYQQKPMIIGGELIKGEWFKRYEVAPKIKHRMIYGDTAQKTAERNDYSVFECWGFGDDGRIYLLDMIRGKWEAPELKRRAIAFWAKQKAADIFMLGQLRKMKIEDKSSGTGLIQEIKDGAHAPIEGVERRKDKYTRLLDVLGYVESGMVCVPLNAPFTNDFVDECEAFSADDSHLHDDQVDPMMDAIEDMLAGQHSVNIWAKLGK